MTIKFSLILASISAVMFSAGSVYEKTNAISENDIQSMNQRIVQLEANKPHEGLIPNPDNSTDLSYAINDIQSKQQASETYLLSMLAKMNDAISQLSTDQASTIPIKTENRLVKKSSLEKSIEFLDQAVINGSIDKLTQKRLDEMVKNMDEEDKRQYWERMFSDILAERYVLPEEDFIPENYQLPDGEVDGET